jgi:hypothetical protein
MARASANAEALARLEAEIRREKAEALRRAGERLEAALVRLAALRAEVERLHGPRRVRVARTHNTLRERARLYRWYLVVQREAVGARAHGEVDELYPIPGRLEEVP